MKQNFWVSKKFGLCPLLWIVFRGFIFKRLWPAGVYVVGLYGFSSKPSHKSLKEAGEGEKNVHQGEIMRKNKNSEARMRILKYIKKVKNLISSGLEWNLKKGSNEITLILLIFMLKCFI